MIQTDVLKANDVAAMLHIGKNAVYALAKSGELGSYHIGRKLLFTPADVEAYIEHRRSQELGLDAKSPSARDIAPSAPARHQPSAVAATPGASRVSTMPADIAPTSATPTTVSAIEDNVRTLYPPFDDQLAIAGMGPITDAIARRIAQFGVRVERRNIGAWAGLVSLYARRANAAVVNLYNYRSNAYNTPFVRTLLPGTPVVVAHLASRRVGFIVAAGNPKKLRTWSSLLHDDVVVANRERGCAERVLLDEKMISMEARPNSITGYGTEHRTSWAMAQTISHGAADVGIGTELDSHLAPKLEFVPLQNETIDLVIDKSEVPRPLIRRTLALLCDATFARDLATATLCDTSICGAITYES